MIVYIYAHAPAQGEELRYSLRSLCNIDPLPHPLLIGDIPDWYTGPRIPMPQQGTKYQDTTRKILAAIESVLVPEEFFLFMDDIVVVQPFTLDALRCYYYRKQIYRPRLTPGEDWGAVVKSTLHYCQELGLTTYDTALHWPYWFEKEKLKKTIETFRATERPVCLEIAYANQWNVPLRLHDPSVFLYNRAGDERLIPQTKVYCYQKMHAGLLRTLKRMFPERSMWESPYTREEQDALHLVCQHRGKIIGTCSGRGCHNGGRPVIEYHCDLFEQNCTETRYMPGQPQLVCRSCTSYVPGGIRWPK